MRYPNRCVVYLDDAQLGAVRAHLKRARDAAPSRTLCRLLGEALEARTPQRRRVGSAAGGAGVVVSPRRSMAVTPASTRRARGQHREESA